MRLCFLVLLFPFYAGADSQLDTVPYEDYSTWPAEQQAAYDQQTRQAFFDFESEFSKVEKMEFAENPIHFWQWLPKAVAAPADKACLVGGVRRSMIAYQDRYACPTGGRPCPGQSDGGFLCGAIYNQACVSREPRTSISSRCLAAAGTSPISEATFNERRSALQSVAADCRSGAIDDRFKSQCRNFLARMNGATASHTTGQREVSRPAGIVPQPPVRSRTPPPMETAAATPPARANRESASGNCMSRNQAKLGALACIACGIESAKPGLAAHGGASNWVALLGVMAQRSYGPYRTNDELSRRSFQQRVAEMVTSYGYCTDREYPVQFPQEARDHIDGRAQRNDNSLRLAQGFGLMSTVNGFFSGQPENQNRPLEFADKIFGDNDRWSGWDTGNSQNRQWRFRSMIKAHSSSYPQSSFSKCARAIEGRLGSDPSFRMCPIRQGQWPNGAPRTLYASHISASEQTNNQKFYKAIATSCGLPEARREPNQFCDNNCWGNYGTFRHATSAMVPCDQGGHETYAQATRKGDEPSGRRNPGKPGETSFARGRYGGDHGGADNPGGSGGGDGGSGPAGPGGGGGGGGGGKGGESGSAR
jgi:uncharacterized membrane protein YgcG